jgi:sigma-B regulation protein RsbU (phosphoserine phosphatase)
MTSPESLGWNDRLHLIEDTMRSISQETDPQSLVHRYGERIQQLTPIDRRLSLSRRHLEAPQVRITRSTSWDEEINPWLQKDRLPVLSGGLLSELCYREHTTLIDDLHVSADDPAFEYLDGYRSLLAMPMYDEGKSLNWVILLQKHAAAFDPEQIPDLVWRSNLFGRATATLVLKSQLEAAWKTVDRELKTVARLQRALLPFELPKIRRLDVTAYYQPASSAGGDYYDFFELPGGLWGVFIGDVSGHGTPAAVMMAVMHCMAHTHPGPVHPPSAVLKYLNKHLTERYSNRIETFVTAFYAIFDPENRKLTYACAGHNPPRLKRCQAGTVITLDKVGGLPLGVMEDFDYQECSIYLQYADQIVLYTDGITETQNAAGEQFGERRIDEVLSNCGLDSSELMEKMLSAVNEFANGHPPHDDRTLIVLRCT